MPSKQLSNGVSQLTLGLYFDRGPLDIPMRGLIDGINFRIYNGKIGNLLIGWKRFSTNWKLAEQVLSIINFFPRNNSEKLVFLTTTDAYDYQSGSDTVLYLTPRYETGTASRAADVVTGVGTAFVANVKVGDYIHFGASGYRDPSGTWSQITEVTDNTHLKTADSGAVGGGAYTIRKIFTASKPDNNWDFDVFVHDTVSGNDQLVVTNGSDYVHSWDGVATQMVSQSAMAFKCKCVLAYKNMMLYANLTNQGGASKPMDLINSDVGTPFLAGATGTGLSEQFVVHDGQDEILALRKLGDMAVCYGERHCVPAQFVGDPLVFIFREAAIDIGPTSQRGIADYGDYHEFLGLDTMYSFDGATLKDINNHVAREMIRTQDPSRKRNIFAHFVEERGEVYFVIPRVDDTGVGDEVTQGDTTWTEHYLETVPDGVGTPFSRREFPFSATGYYKATSSFKWDTIGLTWEEATIAWADQAGATNAPITLAGDDDGYIYIVNTVQQGNGADLNSYVRTGRRQLQANGRGRPLLRRVYPFLSAGMGDLRVTPYMGEHANGSVSSKGDFTLDGTQPEGGHFVSPFKRGRTLELEVGSDSGPWEISGYDIDVTNGGMR